MELWVSVIAPVLVSALSYFCVNVLCENALCKDVSSCFCGKVDYMGELNINLDLLRSALIELLAHRGGVLTRVEAAELNGDQKRLEIVTMWLSQVEAIETNAKQLIDEARGEDTSSQGSSTVLQRLSSYGGWSTDNVLNISSIGEKVFKTLDEVRNLSLYCGKFESAVTQQAPLPVVERREEVQETFGLDTTLEKTWESLKQNRILGIYGMGGVGKTTLLTLINNRFDSVDGDIDVDVVIWVKVTEDAVEDGNKKIQVDIKRIQDTIGERLHISDENWSKYTKTEKAGRIRRVLKGEKSRFVLLLDDLWEEVSLTGIGIPIGSECKIVFTTRSEYVCGRMGFVKAYEKIKVEFLGEKDAWDLFELNARCGGLSHEVSVIAKEIAAMCRGLPLALKVIGTTMASKTTVDQWRRALDNLKSYPTEVKGTDEGIYKVLRLSFDQLEEKDAKCFQYCALFPKAYNIKRDELVEYWIGEGFIDERDGRPKAKDRGYDIIDTLVEACLLLKDGESEDSEQRVFMHDMIRGMVLWVRSNPQNGEIFVVKAGDGLSKLSGVTDWTIATKVSLMNNQIVTIPGDSDEFSNPDRLVTLFLQNNKLVDIVGRLFQVLSTLVVLDLSHNRNIAELPKEISVLVSLRYLSLTGTMIKDLPEGFGNLTQLIHLDLESTSNLESISIKLISKLLKLQVLRFYGSKASLYVSLLKILERLNNLQVLTITVREVAVLEAFLGSELAGKTQGLYLEGVDVSVASFAVTFGALGSLRNLKMINCDIIESDKDWEGKRRNQFSPSTSSNQTTPSNQWFKNLSAVELHSCLGLMDATWLIYAANLESLSIALSPLMEQVISKEKAGNVQAEPFRKLQVLDFDFMDKLKCIYWKPLSSPGLQKVYVTHCPNLPFNSISINKIDVKLNSIASLV